MKLTHKFEELTLEKRPQDLDPDGSALASKPWYNPGGEYPDAMPQAIRLIDAEGRSCITCRSHRAAKSLTHNGLRLILNY